MFLRENVDPSLSAKDDVFEDLSLLPGVQLVGHVKNRVDARVKRVPVSQISGNAALDFGSRPLVLQSMIILEG